MCYNGRATIIQTCHTQVDFPDIPQETVVQLARLHVKHLPGSPSAAVVTFLELLRDPCRLLEMLLAHCDEEDLPGPEHLLRRQKAFRPQNSYAVPRSLLDPLWQLTRGTLVHVLDGAGSMDGFVAEVTKQLRSHPQSMWSFSHL